MFLDNSVLKKFQSGFRSCHSTESTLFKGAQWCCYIFWCQLPCCLSVARPHSSLWCGGPHNPLISCEPIYWQPWHSTSVSPVICLNRSFFVMIDDFSSFSASLFCGLCSRLYPLFTLPLGSVIARRRLSCHCCAEDILVYLRLKPRGNYVMILPTLHWAGWAE